MDTGGPSTARVWEEEGGGRRHGRRTDAAARCVRYSSIAREASDGGHDAGHQRAEVRARRKLGHAGDRDVAARLADRAGKRPAAKRPLSLCLGDLATTSITPAESAISRSMDICSQPTDPFWYLG